MAGDRSDGPTLRQLGYLVAVAEAGSFGAAAVQLAISQPALSTQVAEAERRLGVVMFERGRHGASVTPEGEPVLAAARAVLEAAAHLSEVAASRGGEIAGALRIGVIPTIAPYLLPVIVREVTRRHPGARPHLREQRTSELLVALRGGAIDLAVCALPIDDDLAALTVAELARDPFVLALPDGHPYAGTHRLPQGALASLPMLLLEDGIAFASTQERPARCSGRARSPRCRQPASRR